MDSFSASEEDTAAAECSLAERGVVPCSAGVFVSDVVGRKQAVARHNEIAACSAGRNSSSSSRLDSLSQFR